jgi:hypothetical protein
MGQKVNPISMRLQVNKNGAVSGSQTSATMPSILLKT